MKYLNNSAGSPYLSYISNILLTAKNWTRFRHSVITFIVSALLLALTTSASWLEPRVSSVVAFTENINTFASDCTTPKATWDLGQTACAVATGTPGPRRIVWVAPDGKIADVSTSFSGTGGDNYTFLTSGPFAQYGTWTVKTIDNSGAGYAIARFLVRNAAFDNVDLVISKFGPDTASAGNIIVFRIEVTNLGPDSAQNVVLSEPPPTNTTFVSATQDSGPSFVCTDPAAGCTAASLPANVTASFTFVYRASSSVQDGSLITNTATISSDTNELHPADNSATYSVNIIEAANACTLNCQPDITVDNTAGECGAIISYLDPTPATSEPCGTITCRPPSGSFFKLGTTVVTCGGEFGDPCSFNVMVNNNEGRAITCPANITVAENPTGSGTATVNYASPTGSGCASETITCIPPSGTSFHVGSTSVDCTSSSGLMCGFTINVTSATCTMTCPTDIPVNNSSNQCGAVVNYSNPSGSCGVISCSPPSGSFFPIGTTGVSCTGSGGGNCSFAVTVNDTQAPTVNCPGNVAATEDSPGAGFATVNYSAPTAIDNCAGVTVNCNPPSGSKFFIGSTTVTCTAEDGSENSASCTFTVTVNSSGCTIICPSNVTQPTVPNQCSAVVNYPAPTSSGTSCGATITCTPSSGSVFPIGSTTVSCSDGSGHSCAFAVTVLDTQAPTLICPNTITVTETPIGSGSATVTYATTATDNCSGIASVVCAPPSGSVFPVGQTLVTCTVDDASSNTASCQFVVQVSIYNFQGFFSPVNNPPVLNVVNAGRAIPVKFSLGGNKGLNIFAPAYPVSGEISCDSSAPPSEITETVTAGSSSLSYDAATDKYIYVWSTSSSWAGTCRQLIIRLSDGTEHMAIFKFR